MRIVFDASSAKSARRLDSNGFLHVTGCPITSFGVFDYARSEADLPGDPNELVKVIRRKEVITSEAFIASCQNLPIIDNHTYMEGIVNDAEGGDEDGIDPDKKGVNGTMTNVRFDEASNWVVADLVFYSRTMIRLILADKKVELSLGYTSKFVPLVGEAYAADQIDMSGNHLALVDRARVPGARVLDSAFTHPSREDATMSKPVVKKKTMDSDALAALREALLPALTTFLESQGATAEAAPAVAAEAAPAVEAAPAAAEAEVAAAAPAAEAAPAAAEAATATEAEVAAEASETPQVSDESAEATAAPVCDLIKQLIAALSAPAATGDEVEGTTPTAEAEVKPTADEESEEQMAAKPTMDQMFAAVAQRDALYQRVSRVVGTFDHAAMTHDKVAKYGVKKLGIKCADGHEVTALDAYLLGTEKATAQAAAVTTKKVGDSVVSSSELDAYLAAE